MLPLSTYFLVYTLKPLPQCYCVMWLLSCGVFYGSLPVNHLSHYSHIQDDRNLQKHCISISKPFSTYPDTRILSQGCVLSLLVSVWYLVHTHCVKMSLSVWVSTLWLSKASLLDWYVNKMTLNKPCHAGIKILNIHPDTTSWRRNKVTSSLRNTCPCLSMMKLDFSDY